MATKKRTSRGPKRGSRKPKRGSLKPKRIPRATPSLGRMAESISLLVTNRVPDWEAAYVLSQIAALGSAYASHYGFQAWAGSFAKLERKASDWSGWAARQETEAAESGR